MLILVVDQPVLQAFLLLNHTGKGVCIVYNLLIYANSYKKLKQINPSQNRGKNTLLGLQVLQLEGKQMIVLVEEYRKALTSVQE